MYNTGYSRVVRKVGVKPVLLESKASTVTFLRIGSLDSSGRNGVHEPQSMVTYTVAAYFEVGEPHAPLVSIMEITFMLTGLETHLLQHLTL